MLRNEIKNDPLFQKLAPFAAGMEMVVVDVHKNIKGPTETQVQITVMMREGDTTVDNLAAFHRAVQPLLELEIGREILSMEVSTPGLQRVFKDYWEFEVFNGKMCRVYSTTCSSWVEGMITSADGRCVVLTNCLVVDQNRSEETMEFAYTDIQKAKLEYKWENKKSGDDK